MQVPFLAEVVESGNLTYSENPVSLTGKVLPVGTIRIRPLVNDRRGNVSLAYARPMTLNIGNIPLVGEHVMVIPGLSIDQSIGDFRAVTYYYFPFALNATDDAVINQLPDYDYRTTSPDTKSGGGGGGGRSFAGGLIGGIVSGAVTGGAAGAASNAVGALKSAFNNLPILPGATFPRPVRPIRPLQWYEGDSVFQSRSGSSLRLGSGTAQHPQYASQPDFHSSPDRGSPLFAMVCDEPNGGKPRPLVEIPAAVKALLNFPGLKRVSQKFRTEDLRRVKVGFYGGIGLQLANIIQARTCYISPIRRLKVLGETASVPGFRGSQIVSDSDRVVMNAKRDNIIGLARKRIIFEASKIILITNEHTVDLDDFVNDVQKLAAEVRNLMTGMYPFATPVGPTGPNVALPVFAAISAALNKLNSFPCLPPASPSTPAPPEADFGVNITSAPYGEYAIKGPSFSPTSVDTDPTTSSPSSGGPAIIVGPGTGESAPGSGTPVILTGGSGLPLTGESGTGTSSGGSSTGESSTGGTGGGSNNSGNGPGGSGSGGSGSGGSGSGGSGGGGDSTNSKCQLIVHLVSENQLGWRGAKLQVLSKEIVIEEFTSETSSTLYSLNVAQGTALEFKYVPGLESVETSYVIASDSNILFTNGKCPDPALIYRYECTPKAARTSTIVAFSEQSAATYTVMFYEFKATKVSKTTSTVQPLKIIVGLITAIDIIQGWYIVRGNPGTFMPSEQCLLTQNILADTVTLGKSIQSLNNDHNFNYVDLELKKIPYTLNLKA